MKRILIFSPGVFQSYGHEFDYVNGLASAAAATGTFDIHVLGFDGPFAAKLHAKITVHARHQGGIANAKGGSMFGQIGWGLKRIGQSRSLVRDALDLSARLNTAGIFFESFEYYSLARRVGRFRQPLRCLFHDTSFDRNQTSIAAAVYKRAMVASAVTIVKSCERTFVHGDAMKINLVRTLGLSASLAARVSAIPYGASEPSDVRQVDRAEARAALGLNGDPRPILLAFGTLRKDKEFPRLLEAISMANDWQLLVAGPEGDLGFEELENLARQLGICGRVHYRKGFIASGDQPLYFGAADAVVGIYSQSIRHESGTCKLARTFVKPIIVSGPPDLEEYVRKTGVGWVAADRTAAALAVILSLAAQASTVERSAVEERIYECARQFSWSRVCARVFDAWC